MRIQSINGFIPMRMQRQKQNDSNLSFLGKLTPQQVKKFSLEKKLPYMFEHCQNGDVIAVGKNIAEIKKGLANVVENFTEVIKRILFIKHGGLSVPMAFGKTFVDSWSCVNIGDKKVLISMDDKVEDIEPNDAVEIGDGDVIINNNVNIPIGLSGKYPRIEDVVTDEDKEDFFDDVFLLSDPENFATETYVFDDIQTPKVVKANAEAFDLLDRIENLEVEKIEKIAKAKDPKKITFNDVGGLDNVIQKLEKSIVFPILYPKAHESRDKMNKGIILYGPPGTGKTLIAQALANEIDAYYTKLNGLEMSSKWVGQSEENWRNLFKTAEENQPSIIFIDEFDAVARNRSGKDMYGDDVVNQLLTLMSDVEKENKQIYVITATNRLESLDPAVVRSGRFGESLHVTPPDRNGLEKIWEIHTRGKKLDSSLSKDKFLDKCFENELTGADIAFLVDKANEASWERTGVYEKMRNRTFKESDIDNVAIIDIDLNNALDEMLKSRSKQTRKPVGFAR